MPNKQLAFRGPGRATAQRGGGAAPGCGGNAAGGCAGWTDGVMPAICGSATAKPPGPCQILRPGESTRVARICIGVEILRDMSAIRLLVARTVVGIDQCPAARGYRGA